FYYVSTKSDVKLPYRDVEDIDDWKAKVTQDITELKSSSSKIKTTQEGMQTDIHELQISEKLEDREISNLKETLGEIKDDTNWIRRRITGAVITARSEEHTSELQSRFAIVCRLVLEIKIHVD